jgi:phage gpG-like protein
MAKQLTMGQLAALMAAAAKQVDPTADVKLRTLSQVGVGLMKKEIQNVHAVDTGTMLNSTTAESEGKNTIFIGPTVVYAAYVALGTSRVAARPFHVTAASKLNAEAGDLFSAEDLGI